jgi:chromosome segregation ATPase
MPDTEIALLSAKLETLHGDVAEIKGAMSELTKAIMKLALIEERLATANSAQERAFNAISKLEARICNLEQKAPANDETKKWVDRGITALIGAALMFIWDRVTKGH